MAGDWIKIEHTTPDKPETIRMADILKIDQDAVSGKLIRVWIWADQNSLDGNAVSVTETFLDRLADKKGFAAAMRAVGWLSGDNGNLCFPNFDRQNGETAKSRAQANRRVANHRQRSRNARSVTDETPAALEKPLPEKRREEKRENKQAADAAASPELPLPVAIPAELDTPEFRDLWTRWEERRRKEKKPKTTWEEFFADQLKWLSGFGLAGALESVGNSLRNGYTGLFEPKAKVGARPQTPEEAPRFSDDGLRHVASENSDRFKMLFTKWPTIRAQANRLGLEPV